MSIKAIIFDLGNVILTNDWHCDWPEKFKAFSGYFGITYDEMEKGWYAAYPDFKLCKISEEEFWKIFLRTAGAKKLMLNMPKCYGESVKNSMLKHGACWRSS